MNEEEIKKVVCPECGSYNLKMFNWGIVCKDCDWTTFDLMEEDNK